MEQQQTTLNRPSAPSPRTSGTPPRRSAARGSAGGAREKCARVRAKCARGNNAIPRAISLPSELAGTCVDKGHDHDGDADDDVDGADASRRSGRRGDRREAGMRELPRRGRRGSNGWAMARAGCGGEARRTWAQVRVLPQYLRSCGFPSTRSYETALNPRLSLFCYLANHSTSLQCSE